MAPELAASPFPGSLSEAQNQPPQQQQAPDGRTRVRVCQNPRRFEIRAGGEALPQLCSNNARDLLTLLCLPAEVEVKNQLLIIRKCYGQHRGKLWASPLSLILYRGQRHKQQQGQSLTFGSLGVRAGFHRGTRRWTLATTIPLPHRHVNDAFCAVRAWIRAHFSCVTAHSSCQIYRGTKAHFFSIRNKN